MPIKDYLGDSVYAEYDGYDLILTTENGYGPSNTIVLEPAVLKHLHEFLDRAEEELKRQKEDAFLGDAELQSQGWEPEPPPTP